jgi:Domain of unknown function (DUF4105)
MLARFALVAAVCALIAGTGRPARAEPGDDLTVSVLTFGPGEHPFFKFGHNAIWVKPSTGQGVVFNFGTFAFEGPGLIPKFLRGRLTYWLSASTAESALWSYQAANRSIEVQELDLTAAQRWTLFERLRDNARPDKREYLYDYFWDNCSTRVRDAIDVTVGGRVRLAGQAPASMTLRAHALRMTADLPWEFLGLAFGLGRPTDLPVDQWKESFLPEKLRDLLRRVRIERDGISRPLVKSERVMFQALRPAPPEHPPRWTGWFLLLGLGLGGALAALGVVARRTTLARATLGLAAAGLGGVLGLLGLILVLLWVATNHRAAHANANILQAAPWALALLPLGVGTALGRAWAARAAFLVAASATVLSAAGLAAKVIPGPAQDNVMFIAVLLPTWLGLTFGLGRIAR